MNVYVINGYPQSGKSTFEDYCIAINPIYIRKFSTIDPIKKLAHQIGWNGEKTPQARAFLSDLKKITTDFNDYSFKCVKEFIRLEYDRLVSYDLDADKLTIFVSCREPKEIDKIVHEFGAKTILVRRAQDIINGFSNKSDEDVLNYAYDYVILNDGTLEDLRKKSQAFINKEQ